MRRILSKPGLKYIFAANIISMFGSGMNTAAVTWHILRTTHSEVSLAWLVVLQTIPALLLVPFSGVVIDREDRRHLVMILDGGRGAVILCVAILALMHRVQLWHLYVMGVLVTLGFWFFWPTINALIQELTPGDEFVHANTFLMAGVQGGWLIAGAVVGFMYDRIGLGGVLLIDVATYVASLLCYFAVRKGRQVVERPHDPHALEQEAMGAVRRYVHEMKEGVNFVRNHPAVLKLGTSWALFLGAMITTQVITAPLSDRILHSGAQGYGWLNGAWGVGAFITALFTAAVIDRLGLHRAVTVSFAGLMLGMYLAPFSHLVPLAMALYLMMGACRGLAGIAITSDTMRLVPKHMMGRVQNTFFFSGMMLQLFLSAAVGWVAHHWSLTGSFAMIATVFLVALWLAVGNIPESAVPEDQPPGGATESA